MRRVVLLFILTLIAPAAMAADICEAVAIRDVSPDGTSDYVLKAGQKDTAITQFQINKKTGEESFCSHGGSCYSAKALKLLNCKIGKLDTYQDPDYTFYGIDVVRSKNSAAALRYDDLDNKLLEMGMCSACAGNAADTYIKRPGSRCGRTVKAALEGNPVASKALTDGGACQ